MVKVGVHRAFFLGGREPYYFVKVTNRSSTRDVEITHAWFEGDPKVHMILPQRPLPKRLRPDEQWECWTPAAAMRHVRNVERAARVQLTSGKVVKSRRDTDLPELGYIAGP